MKKFGQDKYQSDDGMSLDKYITEIQETAVVELANDSHSDHDKGGLKNKWKYRKEARANLAKGGKGGKNGKREGKGGKGTYGSAYAGAKGASTWKGYQNGWEGFGKDQGEAKSKGKGNSSKGFGGKKGMHSLESDGGNPETQQETSWAPDAWYDAGDGAWET